MRHLHAKALWIFSLLVGVLISFPPTTQALIYGVTYDSKFITINEATGAGSLVGDLDEAMSPFGLAERDGKLYTYDQRNYVIRELAPGDGHTVSTIDVGAGDPLNIYGEGAITFRSDGIGFLSSGGPTGALGEPGQLWQFDIDFPTISKVGDLTPSFDGMDFNGNGVLFGLEQTDAAEGSPTSDLHTIDTSTAAATLIGSDGGGVWGAYVAGLTFDGNGILYAAIGTRTGPPDMPPPPI
jgi:hypothetical protein